MASGRWAKSLAILAALSLFGMAAAPPARAVDPPPAPIAKELVVLIVDTQRVLQESKAGKAVQSQMQQQMAGYQKGISKQDEEFNAAQQELARQQSILAQDAFAAKVKDFEQKVGEARKKAQEHLKSLSQGEQEAVGKIEVAMLQVLSDIARDRHANLVLQRSTVLLFDTSFDITEEVLKRIDEKMPALTVDLAPAKAPATGAAAATPAASAKPASAAPKKK